MKAFVACKGTICHKVQTLTTHCLSIYAIKISGKTICVWFFQISRDDDFCNFLMPGVMLVNFAADLVGYCKSDESYTAV